MDHTTINYSLLVSIEWDADLSYIFSLERGFKGMANYMYDVSDGQIRFDTIAIFDNKEEWNFADMQIYADNSVWPHVDELNGFNRAFGNTADPIEMPRKWFGSDTATYNGTFNEHPLDMSTASLYRTIAHEFGHYAMSLGDEYVFPDGVTRCEDRKALPYGYMDYQYPDGGVYSSELSSASTYSDAKCQNNSHWNKFKQSTWQTLEALYQKSYNGILAPIIRPSERSLKKDFDYLPGPNDSTSKLDYDVGELVVFPITHDFPAARSIRIRLRQEADPDSKVRSHVRLSLRDTLVGSPYENIKLGKTSVDGGMWVVGKFPGHVIAGSGYIHRLPSRSSVEHERTWLYLGTVDDYTDSMVIGLREVQGDYSVISRVQLGASDFTYRLDAFNPFQSAPTIEHQPDGGDASNHTFIADAGGYSVSITDSLVASGTFTLSAVDDSGAAYTFDADYSTKEIDLGSVAVIKGPRGVSEAIIDNIDNTIENALLLSTYYPVLRTGISTSAIQGGPAQNLAVFPELSFTGNNSITVRYSDADLSVGSGSFGLEESLRIFYWNTSSQQWELVGGSVDTAFNEVTASIASAGVYAAFTTDIATDINDDLEDSSLPESFELNQNFPNPFNPVTTISFNLPVASEVRLEVYNILGQVVETLYEGRLSAGVHSYTWDGSTAASGVYLYRLTAGDYIESKKMMLLK